MSPTNIYDSIHQIHPIYCLQKHFNQFHFTSPQSWGACLWFISPDCKQSLVKVGRVNVDKSVKTHYRVVTWEIDGKEFDGDTSDAISPLSKLIKTTLVS